MSTNNAARFFDTSGCLNLARPSSGTRIASAKQPKQNVNRPGLIRGQVKIDLYNFDHIDFADSQYVLTSPRSLEACARLNIKPTILLPRKLADITSDKVRFSTIVDIRDEMEIERLVIMKSILAKLQRCREEREKIIREEELSRPSIENEVDPKTSNVDMKSTVQRNSTKAKLRPATTATATRNSMNVHRPPRPTSSNRPTRTTSNVKPTVMQWPSADNQNELRTSSSTSFLDDVRRMDESLQRLGTSKASKNERYIYDHELKIQKARENARRTEQEKEAERYESLMHDVVDQTMAEERRQNELRRKLERLHHSRQLYETLQAKNHELQMVDVQRRRSQLLNEIKRKDRRTQDFVKEKQEANNLFRTLAKSSQDTREYIREINENFDQKARRAELASSILVTKPKLPVDRRFIQSSVRT